VEITSRVVDMGVLMIVMRDISESKKLRDEISRQNDLIQRVLENIPDAVAVLNADRDIIWLNATFRRIFSQTGKQAIGLPVTRIINNETIVEALNYLSQSPDITLQKEFKLDQNGKAAIFTLDLTRMEKEYLLVIRDITEARARQENLYLTNRLASVGEMASGIAHELNNPLTSIVGLSSLILKSDLTEEIKQDITDVHNEARRAASIIKNMLTFARRHVSQKQVLQINDILEDVLKLRNYEHKCHNIQVNCNLNKEMPPVNADYLQLQQVFLNIILNAESAMIDSHGQGTLSIETGRVNGHIKVLFKDDGPGILKENMTHIFDPFFTTKEVGKGTGLGLSISYGIIRNHGGRIYAQSEYGKGATFIVELPVLN
jgi:PAS domain S-box-containing protein